MTNYGVEDIKTLSPIEGIRTRPGMYIGGTDNDCMHHLLLEVVSNSIDEAINGFGNRIVITIKDKIACVEDFGRGIPFGVNKEGKEVIVEVCTKTHSGGKFDQGNYSVSGGLNGIGITAVNALSSLFKIHSYRDNQHCEVDFQKGELKNKSITKKIITSGTEIEFIPDETIFTDNEWKEEWILNEIELLSYLTKKIEFTVNFNGHITKFLSTNGLKDLIANKVENGITDIININTEKENFNVEIAFQYVKSGQEQFYAFTNNIPNPKGGTHVTGFKSGFTTAFNKLCRSEGLLTDKDENFNGEMLRNGITVALNIKMKQAPLFDAQTKQELKTSEARGAVSNAITVNLEKVLSKKDLKTIFDKAMIEKKASDAAKRSREAAAKVSKGGKNLNTLRDLPLTLTDCEDHLDSELFIVEGRSAAGGAKETRNTVNQAVFALRGKILNTNDKDLADVLKSDVIKDLILSLGCGIGENFNINNLRYQRIIIMADADVDGGHIALLLLTLFLKHLPQLILQNKIFLACSPLFIKKTGKKTLYFYTNEELKKNQASGTIGRIKGLGEMDPSELYETTLNPAKRKLLNLTTSNLDSTLQLFENLMGSKPSLRREFILNNKLNNLELEDVFIEDEEEDEE